MIRFGLTGGIATGKSLVAGIFRAHGVPVVDADQLARRVVEPGEPALARVVSAFGAGVLRPDGSLDRPALGRLITADPQARRTLEQITHPAIFEGMMRFFAEQDAAGATSAGVEATLLVESGRARDRNLFDQIVVVSCRPRTQVERLVHHRGLTEPEALAWLGAQAPLSDKEAVADVLIWNDGDPQELRAQVEAALRAWGARSG